MSVAHRNALAEREKRENERRQAEARDQQKKDEEARKLAERIDKERIKREAEVSKKNAEIAREEGGGKTPSGKRVYRMPPSACARLRQRIRLSSTSRRAAAMTRQRARVCPPTPRN